METGTQTDTGFLPATPSFDDMLAQIGIGTKGNGWPGLDQAEAPSHMPVSGSLADLKRSYAQFAAHPVGQIILNDLLNRTLRRGCSHPDGLNATLEQEALYGRERKGENGMMCHILKMVHDGRLLPDPNSIKDNA